MTSENLITAPVGTTLEEAKKILGKARKEKLPIVDDDYKLRGLITIKDIEKSVKYPSSAHDSQGRLLAGAAVGITANVMDRVQALVNSSVLGNNDVSIAQVVQKSRKDGVAELVIITDVVAEKNFNDAMTVFNGLSVVKEIAGVIRVY